jgi:YbbR domain-containing protein
MKRWLQNNGALKGIALVLAIFIWAFVKTITSDTRVVEGVMIEPRTAAGVAATTLTPRTVSVTVRGTAADVAQASRGELFVMPNITHLTAVGRHAVKLNLGDVRHPRRVEVISVEPTTIVVRLEKAAD